MTSINEFLIEISRRLRDVNRRQFKEPFLIKALNSALVALCNKDHAAYTETRDLDLAKGTSQSLPPDLHRLVRVLHNVKLDGSAGLPCTRVDQAVMDSAAPGWRNDPSRGHARHWMQSDSETRRFDIWPQAGDPEPENPGEEPFDIVNNPDAKILGDFPPTATLSGGYTQSFSSNPPNKIEAYTNDQSVIDTINNREGAANAIITPSKHEAQLSSSEPEKNTNIYDIVMPDQVPSNWENNFTTAANFAGGANFGEGPNATLSTSYTLNEVDGHTPVRYGDERLRGNTIRVAQAYGTGASAPKWRLMGVVVDGVLVHQKPVATLKVHADSSFGFSPYVETQDEIDAINNRRGAGTPISGSDAEIYSQFAYNRFNIVMTGAQSIGSPQDEVKICSQVKLGNVNGGFGNVHFDELYDQDGSTELLYGDPRLQDGAVIQVIRRVASGGGYSVVSFNAEDLVTEDSLAEYNVALDFFSSRNDVYQAWLANPTDKLRVVATSIPLISETDIDADLPIDRFYELALSEFTLYYAYAVDDEMTANSGRAARHWQNGLQLLNITEDTDRKINDNSEQDER